MFKIGDRVKLNTIVCHLPLGSTGTVVEVSSNPFVSWDNWSKGHNGSSGIEKMGYRKNSIYCVGDTYLDLLEKEFLFKRGDKVRLKGTKKYKDSIYANWEKTGLKKGDIVTVKSVFYDDGEVSIEEGSFVFGEEDIELINNNNCDETINPVKKIMSNIIDFAKNLSLSADEKLLRKHNLKDSFGEYTSEARELVIQKLIADNEQYFVDIATKKETSENKK